VKIRFRYGEKKVGEVLLLENSAFVIHDIDAEQKEVSSAKLSKEGRLVDLAKSSVEEMDAALAKLQLPPKVFLKEALFDSLRTMFGKDVEILLNY
jgi:hypothetical protein